MPQIRVTLRRKRIHDVARVPPPLRVLRRVAGRRLGPGRVVLLARVHRYRLRENRVGRDVMPRLLRHGLVRGAWRGRALNGT